MQADPQTAAAIAALLDRYAAALSALDADALVALHSEDADMVAIGPGASEVYRGINALGDGLRRELARRDRMSARFANAAVSIPSGPKGAPPAAAWVEATLEGNLSAQGRVSTFSGRFTAALDRQGGEWLIAQSHLSFAAPGWG